MKTSNEIYEQVYAIESKPLSEDWIASLGDLESIRPIDPSNSLQVSWAGQAGYSLRLFGSKADVQVAESVLPAIRVIFFGELYQMSETTDVGSPNLGSSNGFAEAVLQTYLDLGEDFLTQLKGVFAIILWDGQRQCLYCVRDRIGGIPLFFTETHQEFLLAVSIDALLAQPKVSKEINRIGIAEFFCNRWPRKDETYWANIQRVPAGQVLKVSSTGRQSYRYWNPAPLDQEVDWIGDDEVEQFDALLSLAVRRCVKHDRVGILLSGGIDSVTVATMTADLAQREEFPSPSAYSLIFPYPGANEEDIQRDVAEKLHISQFICSLLDTMGSDGIIASALGISRQRPVPTLSLWTPGYQFLGLQARENGLRTLLTGGGGDEWLGVSPYYAADLIRSFQFGQLFDYLRHVSDSYNSPTSRLLNNILWKYGARPVIGLYGGQLLRKIAPGYLVQRRTDLNTRSIPAWIAPDPAIHREMIERDKQNIESTLRDKAPASLYIKDIEAGLDHPLVSMEYEESFEGARRLGLQKMAPFQDFELAEFLIRTPPTYLNQGGRSKGLVRNMLAKRYPNLGFDKQKKRAGTQFFRETLLREGGTIWERMGGTPTLAEMGVVDLNKLDGYIRKIFNREENPHHSWKIWHLLNAEAWCLRNFYG